MKLPDFIGLEISEALRRFHNLTPIVEYFIVMEDKFKYLRDRQKNNLEKLLVDWSYYFFLNCASCFLRGQWPMARVAARCSIESAWYHLRLIGGEFHDEGTDSFSPERFQQHAYRKGKPLKVYSAIYPAIDETIVLYEALGENGPHAYFKAFAERTIEKGEMKLFITDGRGQRDESREFLKIADVFTHVFRVHGIRLEKHMGYGLTLLEVMGRVDAIRSADIKD